MKGRLLITILEPESLVDKIHDQIYSGVEKEKMKGTVPNLPPLDELRAVIRGQSPSK